MQCAGVQCIMVIAQTQQREQFNVFVKYIHLTLST